MISLPGGCWLDGSEGLKGTDPKISQERSELGMEAFYVFAIWRRGGGGEETTRAPRTLEPPRSSGARGKTRRAKTNDPDACWTRLGGEWQGQVREHQRPDSSKLCNSLQ
jgi:hypothetical protein